MLLVKTELKPSGVHGLGVFAAQFISAGTRVWEYCEGFDHRLSAEFVESLPEPAQSTLRHYSALWGGGFVVSADDARFLNHSERPNLKTLADPDIDYALRDIEIGEELLEDYREFDESRKDGAVCPKCNQPTSTHWKNTTNGETGCSVFLVNSAITAGQKGGKA